MTFNPLVVILKENKLIRPYYIDWKRNLNIVLNAENTSLCSQRSVRNNLVRGQPMRKFGLTISGKKANKMSRGYILASMSNVLQHQHQVMPIAYDIMLSFKEIFRDQNRATRFVAMRDLMNITMVEGTPMR